LIYNRRINPGVRYGHPALKQEELNFRESLDVKPNPVPVDAYRFVSIVEQLAEVALVVIVVHRKILG
jgi:hypothetical protein